jgi:Holliday junction resolvase RusA-like endonuclease
VTIIVRGLPKPKGSKRGFAIPVKGKLTKAGKQKHRVVMAESAGEPLADWITDVSAAVQLALRKHPGWIPLDGPVITLTTFYLPRPASLPARILYPTKKPDLDKLIRAVWDVCTKKIWTDDARVVDELTRKRFADAQHPPGMVMTVFPFDEETAGWIR